MTDTATEHLPSYVIDIDNLATLTDDQLWTLFNNNHHAYANQYEKAREAAAVAELRKRGINARRTFNSFRQGGITVNPRFVFWLKADPAHKFGDATSDGLQDRTEWLAMQNYGVTFGGLPCYMTAEEITQAAAQVSNQG